MSHDLRATIDERRAEGKAARSVAPRSAWARWDGTGRGHDALASVLAQNIVRDSDLLPIRHARMARSPWNYYRGAAVVLRSASSSGIFSVVGPRSPPSSRCSMRSALRLPVS